MNFKSTKRKKDHKRKISAISNRQTQLESLEKRELLAGDLVSGNLVEVENSAKAEIQAAYATAAPGATFQHETSKNSRPEGTSDPRLNLAAESVDSLLSAIESDGATIDLGGVLGSLGNQGDDGTRVAPSSTNDTASFLDNLSGQTDDGTTTGESDPTSLLIGAHLGHAGVNLGDSGLPDIGGGTNVEPTVAELTGTSDNSLLSEYKGALSTLPDDSPALPEFKHQDGNVQQGMGLVGPGKAKAQLREVMNPTKTPTTTPEATEPKATEPKDPGPQDPGPEDPGPEEEPWYTRWWKAVFGDNPDPSGEGDRAAMFSIEDIAAFEQRMQERSPSDPPEPDMGSDLDVARFERAVELNRWNTINPVPDGDDAGGAGEQGDAAPVVPTNPLTDPPEPETGSGRDPLPPRPEPLPIF
ncbi:MAG: hypothetical protein GY768_26315 [Planctomycetaceae bacterium]|nr:hypothetical protein [Planctomycetaceae bacterium]